MHGLAVFLCDLARFKEALALFERAYSGFVATLGPDDKETRNFQGWIVATKKRLNEQATDLPHPNPPEPSLDGPRLNRKERWWEMWEREAKKRGSLV